MADPGELNPAIRQAIKLLDEQYELGHFLTLSEYAALTVATKRLLKLHRPHGPAHDSLKDTELKEYE